MCFQRAVYGWLEKVFLHTGCIRCLGFQLLFFFFFGTLVLWVQGLNAAGSGLLYLAVSSSKGDANIALGYRNM